jgi:choline kinase/thiamine kinase-like enzyme
MGVDVVIAAAGFGGRMLEVNRDLHKALLPYLNKPILWHLIVGIPQEYRIVILTGHRADQIKNFCAIAFPSRKIVYLDVDDWVSEKSGTGYSLLQARDVLEESFWYIPCDGVFSPNIYSEIYACNVFWAKSIDSSLSHHYKTFRSNVGKITESFHKIQNLENVKAFTGVMFIHNTEAFMTELETAQCKEFTDSIRIGEMVENLPSWIDLGNPAEFRRHTVAEGDFDFSKSSEYTFECADTIIKWWNSVDVPELKMKKPIARPNLFPREIRSQGEFLIYNRAVGETLYSSVTPDLFDQLLKLLKSQFWEAETRDISADLVDFYEKKTLSRIEMLNKEVLDNELRVAKVNGTPVAYWRDILKEIPWQYLVDKSATTIIHGDLQFDNIIFDKHNHKFTLIDWRPNFGSQTILGDYYYDLAKLLGGIRLNYAKVKKNEFDILLNGNEAILNIPRALNHELLENVLQKFVHSIGLDFRKVELLTPIIYWNMAPLHKEPFKSFLWILGISYLSGIEKFEY